VTLRGRRQNPANSTHATKKKGRVSRGKKNLVTQYTGLKGGKKTSGTTSPREKGKRKKRRIRRFFMGSSFKNQRIPSGVRTKTTGDCVEKGGKEADPFFEKKRTTHLRGGKFVPYENYVDRIYPHLPLSRKKRPLWEKGKR